MNATTWRTAVLALMAACLPAPSLSAAEAFSVAPLVGTHVVGYGHGWHGWHTGWPAVYPGTVYGSYLFGQAARIDALGRYNLNTSAALINREEAISQRLDNEVKYVETHFEKRMLNDSYRSARERPRATREDLERYSQTNLPERLNVEQFDAKRGQIEWPAHFDAPKYAVYRAELETLFAARTAGDSGVGSANYQAIRQLTKAILAELKEEVKLMSPEEYLVARKFVDSLHYEARFAAQPAADVALAQ